MEVAEKERTTVSQAGGGEASTPTLSQALAKLVRAYGAEYIFTLTGAPQDPLIEMQNREGVKVVLARSERSAFAMADAYARVTGKPTFGIVQYGPGATYLPASLIDAYWGSSPLIALSGTTNTTDVAMGKDGSVWITGTFDTTVDLGQGPIVGGPASYVAKLAP